VQLSDIQYPSPSAFGLHVNAVGAAWALVKPMDDRVQVYVWGSPEPFPSSEQLRNLFRLTPAQSRVAKLLIHRRTNAEIAALLGVTVNTARRHVEAVLLRVGVSCRWEVEEAFFRAYSESVPTASP
jgi:DNA-binding NarL/FixJ family response regulator